jgi:hypothetical protein
MGAHANMLFVDLPIDVTHASSPSLLVDNRLPLDVSCVRARSACSAPNVRSARGHDGEPRVRSPAHAPAWLMRKPISFHHPFPDGIDCVRQRTYVNASARPASRCLVSKRRSTHASRAPRSSATVPSTLYHLGSGRYSLHPTILHHRDRGQTTYRLRRSTSWTGVSRPIPSAAEPAMRLYLKHEVMHSVERTTRSP